MTVDLLLNYQTRLTKYLISVKFAVCLLLGRETAEVEAGLEGARVQHLVDLSHVDGTGSTPVSST
jgi:hypothetical protein